MTRITMASLQHELTSAKYQLAELEKKLKAEEQYKKWATEGQNAAQKELEDAHILLDTLGCPLERATKQEYGEKQNALHLRIAAWLVKKAGL